MKLKLLPLLLSLVSAASFTSCASDEPKRKQVVGPDDGGLSKLAWNRPRSWEGNSRYGGMMPTSR